MEQFLMNTYTNYPSGTAGVYRMAAEAAEKGSGCKCKGNDASAAGAADRVSR